MKIGSRVAAIAGAVAICTSMSAGIAQAKVYGAHGQAKGDATIKVEFELKANAKKGSLSRAISIAGLSVENAPFKCSATGYGGRGDYTFMGSHEKPIAIADNGRFDDVYEFSARGHLIERDSLAGKVVGQGRFATVNGFFKAERSEGGLEFNNCSTPRIPFTAKVRL